MLDTFEMPLWEARLKRVGEISIVHSSNRLLQSKIRSYLSTADSTFEHITRSQLTAAMEANFSITYEPLEAFGGGLRAISLAVPTFSGKQVTHQRIQYCAFHLTFHQRAGSNDFTYFLRNGVLGQAEFIRQVYRTARIFTVQPKDSLYSEVLEQYGWKVVTGDVIHCDTGECSFFFNSAEETCLEYYL